jgi:hypothetical protein
VKTEGTAPLSYQWQLNGSNLANSTWIRGATENTLRIQNIQSLDAGNYSVLVSNNYGAVTSSCALLVVHCPPVVAITTPTEGASFSTRDNIPLSAEAFDIDNTVDRVSFFATASATNSQPTLLGILTNSAFSPFTAQLLWTNVSAGLYTITAVAMDTLGATATSAPVSIAVMSPEPLVWLVTPINGTIWLPFANIALGAGTDDDGTVVKVEFFAGTNRVGIVKSHPFTTTWSNVLEGLYTLTAQATDDTGRVGTSSPVNVIVGTVASQPIFRFSQSSYQVSEGMGWISVTILKNLSAAASVNYTSADLSATASSDYAAVSGTLYFADGQISSTFSVPIYDDAQIEGPETFTICLSSPSNGGSIAEPGCAIIAISDNDANTASCLDTAPPSPAPSATGSLCIDLAPSQAYGQWRFPWESCWRNSGVTVSGLAIGNYDVEFKPVDCYMAPTNALIPVGTNGLVRQTFNYTALGVPQLGSIAFNIQPNDIATNPDVDFRGQWQLDGETSWHDSGEILPNITIGVYTVHFKQVPGRVTPADRQLQVVADQINVAEASYLIANAIPAEAILPHSLAFRQITNSYTTGLPYAFAGQIKSDLGWASGFVVKQRVVLTAAHVVFDDVTLSYITGVRWFFQRQAGTYEPLPQVPRGWYVFSGYAAQRAIDDSPGISSPLSQNQDIAALYFLENAGRGGSGGYLVSESTGTEWLLENALKTLVGYPLSCSTQCNPGKMHATDAYDISFTPQFDRVFRTSEILSFPGNSGGPICVQHTNGTFYPAAIYLGGSGETIVRAIDGKAADLINQAEISSHSGENAVGGGVARIVSNFGTSPFCSGWVEVHVGPASALNAGAAWRVSPAYSQYSAYTNFTAQTGRIPVQNGSFAIEFRDIPGFVGPTNITNQVYCNQGIAIYPSYTVEPPQLLWTSNSLNITGISGTSYRIDYTDSLCANPVWTPLVMSVTLTNAITPVGNINGTNQGSRFYRTVWLP